LGGLWHGASWNFVVWGMLHGAYLAIHRLIINKFPRLSEISFFKSKIGMIVSIFVTQYLVFLTWIAFRVRDTDDMLYSMSKYVFLDFHITDTLQFISSNKLSVVIMVLFVVLHFISYKKPNLPEKISKYGSVKWIIFLTISMLTIFLFYDGNPEDFVYFKF